MASCFWTTYTLKLWFSGFCSWLILSVFVYLFIANFHSFAVSQQLMIYLLHYNACILLCFWIRWSGDDFLCIWRLSVCRVVYCSWTVLKCSRNLRSTFHLAPFLHPHPLLPTLIPQVGDCIWEHKFGIEFTAKWIRLNKTIYWLELGSHASVHQHNFSPISLSNFITVWFAQLIQLHPNTVDILNHA